MGFAEGMEDGLSDGGLVAVDDCFLVEVIVGYLVGCFVGFKDRNLSSETKRNKCFSCNERKKKKTTS